MPGNLSRREFLKIGAAALAGAAISAIPVRVPAVYIPSPRPRYVDPFPRAPEQDQGILGRISTFYGLDVRAKPNDTSEIIGKRLRDQVVHIYEEIIPPGIAPDSPWRWYRVWGGYLHNAHIQKVRIHLNDPAPAVPETGVLCEVTVPYTMAMQFNNVQGWIDWRGSRMYYESTHWVTGLVEGPDKTPWYQITSELAKSEIYYAPARHLRLIPAADYAPISPDVPLQHKRIEVSLSEQRLRAYEFGKEIYNCLVSTGIPTRVPKGVLPTATPQGEFRIYAKQPSKHMGTVAGGPEVEADAGFSLPGVPWTSFFKSPGGYALHGTYWHNNFGMQMSHGCVNMRNADALWVFRWSSPVYEAEIKTIDDWERTGYGTEIWIE
jgi:hypothetical protein